MALVVQKYGGHVSRESDKIANVAKKVIKARRKETK